MTVHRVDSDVFESQHLITEGERFDPLGIVMPHSLAFAQIEDTL